MRGYTWHSLRLLAGFSITACIALQGGATEVPREMHGVADNFSAPGVSLAWGVARGADETATTVVLRIATDPAAYPWLAVVGSDPFTKSRGRMMPPTASTAVVDVRMPRAHFAEFPRTEIRLYASEAAVREERAALTVFFLGVPDTTPEFANANQLDAYLRGRVRRAPE